jgi:hypothetical protein
MASRTSHFTSTVKLEYDVNVGYIYILGEKETMGKLAVPVFWTEENYRPENIISIAPHVYSGYKEPMSAD